MGSQSVTSVVIRRVLVITLSYLAILSAIIYMQIDSTLLLLRDKTLVQYANSLGSYLAEDKKGLHLNMPPAEQKLYDSAGRYYQYAIRDTKGQVLFESPVAFLDHYPDAMPDETPDSFEFVDVKNTLFIGKSLRYIVNGKPYMIQVARSKNAADELSRLLTKTFMHKLSYFGLPFLILLAGTIIISIRQIMSPITRAAQQAQRITAAAPELRFDEKDLPTEIKPLVQAVNSALDRLQSGIAAQKQFTANAAHELRTPLSVLRTHLDLMDDRQTAMRLIDDVDAMTRLVTQLLDNVRLDSSAGLPMERMDLAAAVRDSCAAVWPLMVREGRPFEVTGISEPVWIRGNYDSICRSLRNLLENALFHTPQRSPVSVSLENTRVNVSDHGPGIPQEDRDKIFEIFFRKNSSHAAGAGIGLSIVKKSMELHGGNVNVTIGPDGRGSTFVLQFPKENQAL
ncbi:MAG TPA: HAMP domain-containing sensor histidine kinase [Patescibacteria group bacterium]|nr:HAMP domain-containing sensor histidine kinase [Patescibacteria group bacterium]